MMTFKIEDYSGLVNSNISEEKQGPPYLLWPWPEEEGTERKRGLKIFHAVEFRARPGMLPLVVV